MSNMQYKRIQSLKYQHPRGTTKNTTLTPKRIQKSA